MLAGTPFVRHDLAADLPLVGYGEGRSMRMRLQAVMQDLLEGWQEDLDPAWLPVFQHVELGFAAMDATLEFEPWEPIFPVRRGRVFPGQPKDAHMLRAFDDLRPESVRCVILGQDPYPCAAFATGRAFEAGNVARWRELEKMFTHSIRTLLQQIAEARTGRAEFARSIADWAATVAAIENGTLDMPDPDRLAQNWVDQGVLLLNTALTLTRFAVEVSPHQRYAHLPIWRPLIDRALSHLLTRRQGPLVILGFGDTAAAACQAAGLVPSDRPRDGLAYIQRPHPAAGNGILALANQFVLANRALIEAGTHPIAW